VIQSVTGLLTGTRQRFVSEVDSVIQDAASLSERRSSETLIDKAELVIEDAAGS
jgi:hypothetical protein